MNKPKNGQTGCTTGLAWVSSCWYNVLTFFWANPMHINVVKIGNSRGIRIPKPMLEQAGIADAVEIAVEAGRLVISPAKSRPRASWAEKLDRLIAANGEDVQQFADPHAAPNEFDDQEWTWPAHSPADAAR